MILIFVWLLFVFQNLLNNFQENFYIWIKNPLNLILLIVLIIVTMHHSLLGILNIFEDYIQTTRTKKIFSILVEFVSLVLISISIYSIWHIAY